MTAFVRAGVIGYPVRHSKSPLIHAHWIARYGLSGSYEAIEIAPDDLAAKVAALAADGYAGFNVTIPHKETIFKLCDSVDEKARRIGAVNTVRIEGGRLYGTNTDAYGFVENIKQEAPGFDFTRAAAVVLGAGGAARAVIYGLLDEGVAHIVVANRTRDKAETLAATAPGKITVAEWDDRGAILAEASLLVNTTALGMTGKGPLDISLEKLPAHAVVNDIVYAPLVTPLLAEAAARGHRAVTGIGMLLHQARPAFHLWFGVLPSVDDELRARVLS